MDGRLDGVTRSAVISDDRRYRYELDRIWRQASPRAVFVMLNPSTADATEDDATIRRCVGFARRWVLGGTKVVNLYAYRSRNPDALWVVEDPVGPDNSETLCSVAKVSAERGWLVVAAWGANAKPERALEVRDQFVSAGVRMLALGHTAAGAPLHPLARPVRTTTELVNLK